MSKGIEIFFWNWYRLDDPFKNREIENSDKKTSRWSHSTLKLVLLQNHCSRIEKITPQIILEFELMKLGENQHKKIREKQAYCRIERYCLSYTRKA